MAGGRRGASPVRARLGRVCGRTAPRYRHRRAGRVAREGSCVRSRHVRRLVADVRPRPHDPHGGRICRHPRPPRLRRRRKGRQRERRRRCRDGGCERHGRAGRAEHPPRHPSRSGGGGLRRPARAPAAPGGADTTREPGAASGGGAGIRSGRRSSAGAARAARANRAGGGGSGGGGGGGGSRGSGCSACDLGRPAGADRRGRGAPARPGPAGAAIGDRAPAVRVARITVGSADRRHDPRPRRSSDAGRARDNGPGYGRELRRDGDVPRGRARRGDGCIGLEPRSTGERELDPPGRGDRRGSGAAMAARGVGDGRAAGRGATDRPGGALPPASERRRTAPADRTKRSEASPGRSSARAAAHWRLVAGAGPPAHRARRSGDATGGVGRQRHPCGRARGRAHHPRGARPRRPAGRGGGSTSRP
jgi:hypothetical protein